MHPILVRPGRLAAYLAVWLPLGALLAALLALEGALGWKVAIATALPLSVAYGFLSLSAWYLTTGSPFNGDRAARMAATAITAAFVSSGIWLLAARAWFSVVAPSFNLPDVREAFRRAAPTLFAFGFLLYLLATALSVLAAAFAASREAERRGLELQVLAREAELRALRAQIDPHFLFNSLQSISALTTADPQGARRMCLMLADFLRETLSLGAKDRIPLASELALARRFLAIEQMRFGDRLRVDIGSGADESCAVPPLLLQPLIENAVTHGVAHCVDGGTVRVRTERRAVVMRITIENPCDPDRPRGRGTGMGLSNVRQRLRTMYGPEAALSTDEDGGRFVAVLDVPLDGD